MRIVESYLWMITAEELLAWITAIYDRPFGPLTPTPEDEEGRSASPVRECFDRHISNNPMPNGADPDEWAHTYLTNYVNTRDYSLPAKKEMSVVWLRWYVYFVKKYAHRNDETRVLEAMFANVPDASGGSDDDLTDALDAWLAAGGDSEN